MATTSSNLQPQEDAVGKGLKTGALGLISSTVIATASVAPAYSLAATLGFVVVAVGLKSPLVAILAFVPMILTSIGYSELNKKQRQDIWQSLLNSNLIDSAESDKAIIEGHLEHLAEYRLNGRQIRGCRRSV